MTLRIGEPEAPDQETPSQGAVDDGGSDRIEHQLRSPKHGEALGVINGAPREIDEAASRRTLDVRTLEIDTGRGEDGSAVKVPRDRGLVAWDKSQQVVSSLPTLDADMDVVMTPRSVRAGPTGAPGEV
jgi:hypothetical protein